MADAVSRYTMEIDDRKVFVSFRAVCTNVDQKLGPHAPMWIKS